MQWYLFYTFTFNIVILCSRFGQFFLSATGPPLSNKVPNIKKRHVRGGGFFFNFHLRVDTVIIG